jgi:hypothetical protein
MIVENANVKYFRIESAKLLVKDTFGYTNV